MTNNFAEKRPTVVLLAVPNEETQVLQEGGKPKVFKNYTAAQKYVSQFIDRVLMPYINYANERPVRGAGDREETGGRKCLKCKGFLVPSHEVRREMVAGLELEIEQYKCPACD